MHAKKKKTYPVAESSVSNEQTIEHLLNTLLGKVKFDEHSLP